MSPTLETTIVQHLILDNGMRLRHLGDKCVDSGYITKLNWDFIKSQHQNPFQRGSALLQLLRGVDKFTMALLCELLRDRCVNSSHVANMIEKAIQGSSEEIQRARTNVFEINESKPHFPWMKKLLYDGTLNKETWLQSLIGYTTPQWRVADKIVHSWDTLYAIYVTRATAEGFYPLLDWDSFSHPVNSIAVGKLFVALRKKNQLHLINGGLKNHVPNVWDIIMSYPILQEYFNSRMKVVDENFGEKELKKPKGRYTETSSRENMRSTNPLAKAMQRQVISRASTVSSFVYEDQFSHFRTAIFSIMDEHGAWEKLLQTRNLLGGQDMEKFVSTMKRHWAKDRSGEPTRNIIIQLMQNDDDFRCAPLTEFAEELIRLNISDVTANVVKMTSFFDDKIKKAKKSNNMAYQTQFDLRKWLLKHEICEEDQVDVLVPKLQGAGVIHVKSIQGFSKEDLKECGFNTVQAIATLKALNK